MSNIGNKNTPVPITTDQLQDGLVTLAKMAVESKDSSNFSFDPSGTGLTANTVQTAIVELSSTIAALPEIIQSDVRQTVNTGPVDSVGRSDFIAAGTGLQAVTGGLGTTPLNITIGNGFGPRGKVDLSFVIDANVSWNSLPDNTTVYLYLEYDPSGAGTISTGHSTLLPDYGYARPSSPATEQYWYPVDHRSRGERWDGSAWVPVYRVYVGECTTSGGSVTETRSYAYQGKYVGVPATGAANTNVNVNHNIGVRVIRARLLGRFNTASNGYSSGDILDFSAGSSSIDGTGGSWSVDIQGPNNTVYRLPSTVFSIRQRTSGAGTINPNVADFWLICERGF